MHGRASIFVINSIVCIGNFQLMIIYFIIIGDILTSFANEFFNVNGPGFLLHRTFYILLIAVGLSTQIFKREMHELKLTSVLLFTAISLFVGIFAHQVIVLGPGYEPEELASPNWGIGFVTAISVFITAYQFQFNIYAVLRSMRRASEGNKALVLALAMVFGIYTTVSVLSLLLFGPEVRPDVMQNVGEMQAVVESTVLRAVFTMVIVCHVPFAFFSCKDAFVGILDEVDRRAISRDMSKRLLDTSINEASEKPKEDMRPIVYYGGTLFIYLSSVAFALLVRDVGIVFSIGAAIAGSSAQFIWPGYFYLAAEIRKGPQGNAFYRLLSQAYIILGFALFLALMFGTIYGLI